MPEEKRRVRDVMTPNPEIVSEKDAVRDAARIMAKRDTGVVPDRRHQQGATEQVVPCRTPGPG